MRKGKAKRKREPRKEGVEKTHFPHSFKGALALFLLKECGK
jgi:hypothetical protein